jgi:ubiquinone biosynthesis protein COQ4
MKMMDQMKQQFDLGKIRNYGILARAWLRDFAGVQQSGHQFDFEKALDRLGYLNVDKLRQDPHADAFIKERKPMKVLDLDELSLLPNGTVGRAFADLMVDANRLPLIASEKEITDDMSYIAMRLRQTRDLWRVVTSFEETPEGEVAFQAFLLAQGAGSMPAMNIAMQLAKSALMSPSHTHTLVNELCKGWLTGLKSESFFSIDWESHLETSISEMRRRYMHSRQLEKAEEIFNEESEAEGDEDELQTRTSSQRAGKKASKRASKENDAM